MPSRSIRRLSYTALIAAGGWRPLNPWAASARRRACLMEKDSVAGMSISLSARNLPHRETVCVVVAYSFVHRVIPEWADGFVLDIRTTEPDVLQRFVAHARQQLAFTVQFVPATDLVQQIRDDVDGMFLYLDITFLTFHLVALRLGWLKCRAGAKINPTNVSDATHLGD